MNKVEFLYQFTNIFLKEAVRETFLIENWEETGDFDPRYEEYSKATLEMMKIYDTGRLSDSDIQKLFTNKKNEVVVRFNKKFKTHFINELTKYGCTAKIAASLLPKGLFFDDKINIELLKAFRELEEKLSKKEQGEV